MEDELEVLLGLLAVCVFYLLQQRPETRVYYIPAHNVSQVLPFKPFEQLMIVQVDKHIKIFPLHEGVQHFDYANESRLPLDILVEHLHRLIFDEDSPGADVVYPVALYHEIHIDLNQH